MFGIFRAIIFYLLTTGYCSNTLPTKTFELFNQCTWLFINSNSSLQGWKSLQNVFEKICQVSRDCIRIQQTPNCHEEYLESSMGIDQCFVETTQWISNALYKTLTRVKYLDVCLVRFATVKITNFSVTINLTNVGNGLHTITHDKRYPLKVLQSYTFVPFYQFDKYNPVVKVNGDLRVTLIFLLNSYSNTYGLIPVSNLFKKDDSPMFHFILSSVKFFTIPQHLHEVVRNMDIVPRITAFGKDHSLSLESKHNPEELDYNVRYKNLASRIIRRYFNCTNIEPVCWSTFESFKTPTTSIDEINPHTLYKYIPYGGRIQDVGIRYTIIQGYQPNSRFHNGIQSFLYPLDKFIWICIVTLIILICAALNILSHHPILSTIFWLLETSLEQGDDGSLFRSRKTLNEIIIATWILTCVFLRNFYTSTIFADITSELDTLPLPESLSKFVEKEQLVSQYKLLFTKDSQRQIKESYNSNRNEKERTRLKLYLRKPFLVRSTLNITAIMDHGSFQNFHKCTQNIPGIVENGCSTDSLSGTSFSWGLARENVVFMTVANSVKDDFLSTILPLLFQGRSVYRNNESPFLESRTIFALNGVTLYTEQVSKLIGYTYNLGITQYLEELLSKAIYHALQIKKKVTILKKERRLNFNTYVRQNVEEEFRKFRSGALENVFHTKDTSDVGFDEVFEDTSVSWKDLKSVWQLYMTLVIVSIIGFLVEDLKFEFTTKFKFKIRGMF